MHGGTITSGRSATCSVSGAYWINWNSSFSNTTDPFDTATFLPTSNAFSSVMEMRPRFKSSSRFAKPVRTLSPCVSMAVFIASGLVAAKFAGLIESMNWRA
ncbi:hypothetical protein AWB67_06580 [Caballeronia terrestris]|uniref:Uncharacterized protein n=1 Tax=Caballeronia terrestris TaxID=1226301 RepID=A0A158KSA5_9BURK|nr:hypothetical protein AWB67_06580 [Caballeronia terrestris]